MHKEDMAQCMYNGTLFSSERKGNPAIVTTWMHLEGIMTSQSDRESKYYICHLWEEFKCKSKEYTGGYQGPGSMETGGAL